MKKRPASLLILFGATGDLANRKLYPSLYRLYKKGKITENFAVIGVARRELTNEQYQLNIKKSIVSEIDNVKECDLNPHVTHFR